jgi:hypothetical protein
MDGWGGVALTVQQALARRQAAEKFGRQPAPQGEAGPGLDGKPGKMAAMLGRRPVAQGYRTEAGG